MSPGSLYPPELDAWPWLRRTAFLQEQITFVVEVDQLGQVATSGEVLASACSPEGGQIAVGCWSKHLEVWDTSEILPMRE